MGRKMANLGASSLKLLLLLVISLCISSSSSLPNSVNQNQQARARNLSRRHDIDAQIQEKDGHFSAPKLIHQPQGATVQPNEPHTVECPVEARPKADVKWFKDGQLLGSQPAHLEQTGSELMFFQVNEDDTGDYYCQATNQLGSVSSEPFRLTVPSINAGTQESPIRQTTRLPDGQLPAGRTDTPLAALLELLRPTVSLLVLLILVGLIITIQLVYMRRKSREHHRYMKHHPSYSASSGASTGCGSGTSSQISAGECMVDPVLSSLLGRTLSAPSCAMVGSLAAGSKKYRSYRDHLRKVAAANEPDHSNQQHHHNHQQHQHHHFSHNHLQQQQHSQIHSDLVDSYLAQVAGQHHQAEQLFGQQQQQQPLFGQQQLFGQPQLQLPNLYNQSLAAREQARSLLGPNEQLCNQHQSNNYHNHYSTIETNDEDDGEQYEELDQHRQSRSGGAGSASTTSRTASFLAEQPSAGRSKLAPSTHLRGHSGSDSTDSAQFNGVHPKRTAREPSTISNRRQHQQQQLYPDQPSPYAVSSICSSISSAATAAAPTVAPAAAAPTPPNQQPAPPMNSEAMRALSEQFDINQLMILDEGTPLAAGAQIPPPPPQSSPPGSNGEIALALEDRLQHQKKPSKRR